MFQKHNLGICGAMEINRLFMVLVTLLVYAYVVKAFPYSDFDCPEDCVCYFSRVNLVTDCSERNLRFIPHDGLDNSVYTLDMNSNYVTEIEPFPTDIKLKALKLSDNFLTKILKTEFTGLRHLVEIDLSHNFIHYIHPEAFS